MTISSFQIHRVLKAYMKNMKLRAETAREDSTDTFPEDRVTLSEEAVRRRFVIRIGDRVAERLREWEQP
jgi:hypothetical protein